MAIGFPPQPAYPLALDSDRTLFLVFNTTESPLAENNLAWAEEIEIVPVGADELEIWADNGFANLEGELLYYDAVEKINGKVFKLKRIARNIGGNQTKPNPAGTVIRGMVCAEHHNQLVETVCLVEKFLEGLADCLNRLDEEICPDDHRCPEVDFSFEIDEDASNSCSGTVANFDVNINGDFNIFRIDFGDGTSSTDLSGQHTYPPNTVIDPVVTVTNDDCQVVQSSLVREQPDEPVPGEEVEPFEIVIPDAPDFPAIIIPDVTLPETTLVFPPIIFPDLTIDPPVISIDPPTISIEPPTISIEPPIIPPISFEPPPAFPPIGFEEPPTISCCITIKCPSSSVTPTPFMAYDFIDEFDEDWDDDLSYGDGGEGLLYGDAVETKQGDFEFPPLALDMDADSLGIPSEIPIIAPEIPDIKMIHDLPEKIAIESNIPSVIKLESEQIIPNKITIEGIPDPIKIDASDIPTAITLEVPEDLPRSIKLDASGIPDFIELRGNIPSEITAKLVVPENLEIPLVYKGGPVPIKLDTTSLVGENDDLPCFALVPCKK